MAAREEIVLIVDDDPGVRALLGDLLDGHGYPCRFASGAAEARAQLEHDEVALMLCDVNMPGESGLSLLRDVLTQHPTVASVMVTGLDDPDLAEIALELGAYGYLIKPFTLTEVLINVSNALRRRGLELDRRSYQDRLERTVVARTESLRQTVAELAATTAELRVSREQTVRRLAAAVEFRSVETGGHIERMSRYCELLARQLGGDSERCQLVRTASPMHDVGKIGIPDSVLHKRGVLTPGERAVMERHADIGYRILSPPENELLQLAGAIAWTHHERFDGSGYPRGLAGEEIPIEGRVAAVADAFDALTSDRSYRSAVSVDEALSELRSSRGSHFDPDVLDAFLDPIDELVAIKEVQERAGTQFLSV